MTFQIVADSSSDVLSLPHVSYAQVPLAIRAGGVTYVDDAALDVSGMVDALRAGKGKSSTACPGLEDWLNAFGDAERVICVTITSALSGTCSAAKVAAREYEETHPGRRAYVLDSLSTGPEMRLILEKLDELAAPDADFDAVVQEIEAYRRHTHLLFCLQSLHNLVVNGRVNAAVGALVGLLGIRVIGQASAKGELEIVAKARGEKKAQKAVWSAMSAHGYAGGKVRITHCRNAEGAEALARTIREAWPGADVSVGPARGLCSYYAEEGGLLVGYEGA